MVGEELTVLLVEDNPGDARLIEEMLREAGELPQRADAGDARPLHVRHETRLDAGLDALDASRVDVVLLDLNLPDSAGLDTLAALVEATERLPVIVLTGLDDRQLGVRAIEHGAQDYLVKDDVTSDLLVRSIHYAIERNRQERERAQRREQLEALNRLNRISQDVTHAVITTSTREDLEQAVCERLIESDAYRFAWIGEVQGANGRITPRVSAGVSDDYLDDVTINVGEDSEPGPAALAVQNHEVQVMRNIRTDPSYEPWREEALARDFRSSVAIPIVYEEILYGVLNVYATSPNAFSDPEAEILGRMGDVIGHAIAAIERKEALVSDTVVELEFRVDDFATELAALTADDGCEIRITNLIRNEESLLAYGNATGVSWETFNDAAERTAVVDDVRSLGGSDGEYGFELRTSAAGGLFDALANHGGSVASATVSDGTVAFVVEFPQGRDTRPLIELVVEHCPKATLQAQRTGQSREGNQSAGGLAFDDRLTEKQRTALETAYLAGHFEWPRESTGEEIAERLGISPPTFHQHLRAAEKEFFDLVFDDGAGAGDGSGTR